MTDVGICSDVIIKRVAKSENHNHGKALGGQEVFYDFLQRPAPTRSSCFISLLQFLCMPTQKPLLAPLFWQSQFGPSVYPQAGNLGKYNPFKSVSHSLCQ